MYRWNRLVTFLFVLVLSASLSLSARAQEITGEISGAVTDSSGALVPGATITITNTETKKVVRTIHSDSKGIYTAPLLQVGTYSVEVTGPGFQTRNVDDIEVDVSSSIKLNFELVPGTNTAVEVTSNASQAAPELENGAVNSVISGAEMKDLALNTRNFEQLIQLQPGVAFGGTSDQIYTGRVKPNGSKNNADLAINGLRPDQNEFTLDGADMLEHNTGQQPVIFPNVEALQEFKVLRNTYGAQYGGGGNAQIQLVTRAGGSAYHGEAHVFARNSIFNANDYFNNQAGQPRPEDSQYSGGFTVGGPVFIPHLLSKDKANTFFFYALERNHSAVATVQNITNVPTAAQLAGNFGTDIVCVVPNAAGTGCAPNAAGARVQQITNIDPTAQAYITDVLSHLPAPNNPNDRQGIINDQLGTHDEFQNLVRLDRTFGSRISAFFRFDNDPINVLAPNGINGGVQYPGFATTVETTAGTAYLLHGTYALSSATVLDASASYQPYNILSHPIGLLSTVDPDNNDAKDIQITTPYQVSPTLNRIPSIYIGTAHFEAFGSQIDQSESFQLFANIFHSAGRHSISTGINSELYREKLNQGTLNAGQFQFQSCCVPTNLTVSATGAPGTAATAFEQSLAQFLTGYVSNFSQNSIDPVSNSHVYMVEAYVQDDWKALPRLTINGGVRYSFFHQLEASQNTLGGFAPAAYVPANAPTVDSTGATCITAPCAGGGLPNPNYNPFNGLIEANVNSPFGREIMAQPTLNFAPRVGFAYDVFGDGKTSLRGGYGIFFEQTQLNTAHQTIFNNPAYVEVASFNRPTFANPGSTGSGGLSFQAYGLGTNWHTPYTQGYSLEIQQQLPGNTILDIAYSGNRSTHLPGQIDINQPYPGQYLTSGVIPCNTNAVNPPGPTCGALGQKAVNTTNTPYLNQIRPYLGYGVIVSEQTVFTANYNALQTSVNRRITAQSRISLNYTWSRNLTDSQGTTTPANNNAGAPLNSYNIRGEYGLANFDRRHVFTAHFVYEFPYRKQQLGLKGHLIGGYELSGIVTAASGLPLTVTEYMSDPAGQGILAANSPESTRSDQVFNPNQGNAHTQLSWFNAANFPREPNGSGNVANETVGVLRGPGYQVWNLDLIKNTRIHDRQEIQFRVEAFNLFNHVNWTTISLLSSNANFGQVTNDRNPRQLQVGAKFVY